MKKLLYLSMMLFVMVIVACDKNKDDDVQTATGNIHGLVTDYFNANTPIAGATVTLNTKGLSKTTGSDGRFEFTNIEPGTYTLQVMANNYQATTKQVTVYRNQNAICDFQMSKKSTNIDIDPMNLYFTKDKSQMSFSIKNNSSNSLNYRISEIPSYISVSSTEGLIQGYGGSNAIIATVANRSAIENSINGQMIVTVGIEQFVINIFIEGTKGSDGNGSGEGSGGNGNGNGSNVTRGLLAYYNFNDGTTNNSNGGSNNGTIRGSNSSYITDTPNGTGQALSLGSQNYVRIPNNLLSGANAFSISMWVKDFGSGALFTTTFTDDVFNGAPRLYVNGSNSFMADGCAEIFESSENLGVSATNYQGSGWHMITATFGNKQICLYIDGSLVSSVTHYSKTEGYGNMMAIGGKANDWWNSSMKVDNVRIYDVKLTESEVASIYQYEK